MPFEDNLTEHTICASVAFRGSRTSGEEGRTGTASKLSVLHFCLVEEAEVRR